MSATTIEYTINGRPLRTVAQRLVTAEGTQSAPAFVGDDVQVYGADGAVNVHTVGQQRRPDDIARITFACSIKGIDPDTGQINPGGTLADYLANVDDAIRMFRARTLLIEAERPDGTIRQAIGHLRPGETLDFTRERSHPAFGRYVAVVDIPAGRWTDPEPVTTGMLALASGATVDLSPWAAATAVCTDLQLDFGPVTNPRLEKTDGWWGRGIVVASGRRMFVDAATGIISSGSGAVWTPGYMGLDYSPGPSYFEVDPTQPLEAVFTHSGGGTAQLAITGPRHYATS